MRRVAREGKCSVAVMIFLVVVALLIAVPALYSLSRQRALPAVDGEAPAFVEAPAGLEQEVAAKLAEADVAALRATYLEQNELVYTGDLLPAATVAAMIAEANALRPHVQRKTVPLYKSSGSVSYYRLRAEAPVIASLYRSPALLALIERVTGAKLVTCPDDDPHAAALYYYTEPGDRVGYHYDSSHYQGARYTVLLGLVERSTARLVCQLYKDDATRETVELRLATEPGLFILFNGNNLYHSVSPLGANEERIVLTYEYLTSTAISPLRKKLSDLKDAMTYFGFRELLFPPRRGTRR